MNNFIGFDKYKISGAYHWTAIQNNDEYIAQSNIIINEAVDNNYKSILDIGCGDGAISGKIALLLTESKIYGFDAEESAINCANIKIKELRLDNIKLNHSLISDAKELYYDKSFDMIFSLDVIEHLPNPKELLDFMRYYQKENSSILIGTPLFIHKDLVSPYHVTEYTKEEIRNLVGYSNISVEWILPGSRKNNLTKEKNYYEESYYICKIFFKD